MHGVVKMVNGSEWEMGEPSSNSIRFRKIHLHINTVGKGTILIGYFTDTPNPRVISRRIR